MIYFWQTEILKKSWAQWHSCNVSPSGRGRQILWFRGQSGLQNKTRTARATLRNPVSKTKKQNKTKKKFLKKKKKELFQNYMKLQKHYLENENYPRESV